MANFHECVIIATLYQINPHTKESSQGYFDADTWFDGDELDDYAKGSAVVFASIIVDGRAVCTKFVTIVQEADDGKPGHVGRWYYYAGDWASGATYTMQETQAPFVKRGDSFYMLDFGNSGATTGTTQLDPDSNYNPESGKGSKPWTLMQSTMQYYIAQAFFGPYAHFGSFIINGDWMISQYGTLVSSNGTRITINADNVSLQYGGKIPYVWFDPTDPTAGTNPQSGSYKFIPNFAVDGLTGKTYQNDAYIRGEVYAESGVFNGTVYATNGVFKGSLYTPAVTITSDNFFSYHAQQTQSIWVLMVENSTSLLYTYFPQGYISLPITEGMENYEGVELRIVNIQSKAIAISNISVRNVAQGSGEFAQWASNRSVSLYMGDVLVVRLINAKGTLRWLIMSFTKNYTSAYDTYA